MLPAAAIFKFPWELLTIAVKDGDSVRTFGRLLSYHPEESIAILTSHHSSTQYDVVVKTTFVEPFDPILGAQYLVIGEIEHSEGGSRVIVSARVLNCVDGVNLALLQKAILEQRNYWKERGNEETLTQPL